MTPQQVYIWIAGFHLPDVMSMSWPGTKTKEYQCDICNETFSQSHCVKRHKQSVHEKIRFPCNMCDKSFTQVAQLRRHQRIYHPEPEATSQ
ncbi:hypothetical protein LSH36_79g11055 [Paralvinella palmiformis]|uniref:C2H2-type domain-containing protein n=1 Tax=Paralvinella palmiformis TaxID=53620 RepID=A0AAD9K2C8_9ANNE|nr:hypothetical protein LSH36_79g11055 [Paralvinella palmiformis]